MKIIAVGDNVVDCYLDQKIYYPGGNAVNVAVNCKRYGAEKSSYIGIFGDDEPAEHIKKSLESESVDYSYSRRVYAPSGKPQVNHTKEGDRFFLESKKDTAQHIFRLNLTLIELEHISTFDICHTSIYSNIEHELENLSKKCKVSFDFSDDFTLDYVKSVIHNIKFAFFSGSDRNEKELEELINVAISSGVEVVGITLGSEGALFVKNGERYLQKIKSAQVIDTMGAGDSFIAAFLTSYITHGNMKKALDFAATCAAESCSYFGGFGYPHPFSDLT
jgi:fructoselysine 6-kinase